MQPDVAFPSKVAFSAFQIHPSEHLQATGGGGPALIENPIGTGPYKLEKWQKGDSIILTRNDDYWGEKAKAETLVFRWQKEAAARLLELQAGTVDGIDNPGADDFDTIENDSTLKLYPRPALNVFYLGMNRDKPPFDNEKVRQALAIGLDRKRIVDNFYPEGSEVATHFTPCAIPGGCEGEAWYDFDLDGGQGPAEGSRLRERLHRRSCLPRRRARLPARTGCWSPRTSRRSSRSWASPSTSR